jgi:hypothetical protein
MDVDIDTYMEMDMNTDMGMDMGLYMYPGINTDMDTDMGRNIDTDLDPYMILDMNADIDMDIGFFHKCFLSHNFVCRDIAITKYRVIRMLRNYT